MNIVNKKDIASLLQRDKIFRSIKEQFGIPPDWQRSPGFVSLSKIILEQQVSLPSAKAHFTKLNAHLKAFTPVNILELTDEEMFRCQISRQETRYLRALSKAVLVKSIDLDSLHELKQQDARAKLMNIKGIGTWTADVYLLFCHQSKDIFPVGDVALINTLKELTGASTQKEILTKSEPWRPLRSLATYFLWYYYLKKRNRSTLLE